MTQVDARRPESVAGVEASEVARGLGVDVAVGLSRAEAASRLQANGPNKLTGGKKESGFEAFVRQYQ
ncbi:cation-transporting P-type ATPase, partial [Stenotrophomonas maltophilia]|uniref:cation-transporting P-type ATPase n=1 Tax=Stenotrophomonas maltophilia TaxID=40324 RepID=UPI0034DB05DD